MEETSLEQMLDTLAAEGRVRRLAQHDCADLPRWCSRRQRRVDLLRYTAAAGILLFFLLPARMLAKETGVRYSSDSNYDYIASVSNLDTALATL